MQHEFLQGLRPASVPPISVSRWPSLVLFTNFQQHKGQQHQDHSQDITNNMIPDEDQARQDYARHGGATDQTLCPVQQGLVGCILSFRLPKKPPGHCGDSLPRDCGGCAVSAINCSPQTHTPLSTTEGLQVVVRIFSRQVLMMFACEALLASWHSTTKNCNGNEATNSASSDSPSGRSAFAKWCGCEAKSSSPRSFCRRMSFLFFLISSADVPKGKRKIFW